MTASVPLRHTSTVKVDAPPQRRSTRDWPFFARETLAVNEMGVVVVGLVLVVFDVVVVEVVEVVVLDAAIRAETAERTDGSAA